MKDFVQMQASGMRNFKLNLRQLLIINFHFLMKITKVLDKPEKINLLLSLKIAHLVF